MMVRLQSREISKKIFLPKIFKIAAQMSVMKKLEIKKTNFIFWIYRVGRNQCFGWLGKVIQLRLKTTNQEESSGQQATIIFKEEELWSDPDSRKR